MQPDHQAPCLTVRMGKKAPSQIKEDSMTHLATMMFNDMPGGIGLWMFLSIGAVALFVVFIPAVVYIGNRRQEREAYYKAETLRRITESSGEGAKAALETMREEARREARKMRE